MAEPPSLVPLTTAENTVLAPESTSLTPKILYVSAIWADFRRAGQQRNFGAQMRFGSGPAAEFDGVVFPRIVLMKIVVFLCHYV
jgi:hypothetical protein